jgi:undecaprenyl-diphosphatase
MTNLSNAWMAAILGVVEGITEFLPISSTGHLILAGELLGFSDNPLSGTFEVVIQLGAILAVVVMFRERFVDLARFRPATGFHGRRGVGLLFLTTLPALGFGYLAHDTIKEHLFSPSSVGIGLALGAVWILITEHSYRQTDPRPLDDLTWKVALGIGLFQCLAMWPGMSRSACTILGAMLLGLNRKAATEYSFFAAVPVMVAATSYDLFKNWDALTQDSWMLLAIGLVTAFISAWFAVKALVAFVGRHSLSAFAWYRLALAGLVFLVF